MPERSRTILCLVAAALLGAAPRVCAQAGDSAGPPAPAGAANDAPGRDEASMPLGAPRDRPGPRQAEPAGPSILRTGVALGAVVSCAVGLGALARRLARGRGGLIGALGPGGRAPSGLLEVLARYPIGRGGTLVVLKLDRRVLLVSQSLGRAGGGTMATLCEITDPDEVASILLKARDDEGKSHAERFQALLRGEATAFSHGAGEQPLIDGPIAAMRTRLAGLRGARGAGA